MRVSGRRDWSGMCSRSSCGCWFGPTFRSLAGSIRIIPRLCECISRCLVPLQLFAQVILALLRLRHTPPEDRQLLLFSLFLLGQRSETLTMGFALLLDSIEDRTPLLDERGSALIELFRTSECDAGGELLIRELQLELLRLEEQDA